MATIGLCFKCEHCTRVVPAVLENNGRHMLPSYVWCDLSENGIVDWKTEAPDDCPFKVEHVVTKEWVSEMVEQEELV